MKILVTGANGQLGNEIRELHAGFPQDEFLFTDVAELDISNGEAVMDFVKEHHPGAIINCAAYTAVDKAETEEEIAFLVNATAAENLARAAKASGAILVHISTDYVFDGKAWAPYTETSPTHPVSAYARSKYQGEQNILMVNPRALIIRTSWLYSAFGNNFVKTMLRVGRERGKLNVVFDQTGSPTYAYDLAKAILGILPALETLESTEIFHYSNEGVCSWFDFAVAILRMSGVPCEVHPITTAEYPLPAVRPCYSVLHKGKIRERFSLSIPYWRDSLEHCLERLQNQA